VSTRVSEGESKVSRQGGLPRNPRARRSKPKMASLYFWWPSEDSCCVTMVEPPVSYLESAVPTAACEIAVSVRSAGCACFARRGGISSTAVCLLRYFLRTATLILLRQTLSSPLLVRIFSHVLPLFSFLSSRTWCRRSASLSSPAGPVLF
jgi:hypothetical protein